MKNRYARSDYGGSAQYIFDKIQKVLISHNAKSINFEYKDGRASALIFVIEVSGQDFGFKLPARVENVERILKADTEPKKQQAYRTAWANIRDWVDSQMALIDTQMVKIEEVFLPFLVTNRITNETLFEKYQSSFKELETPKNA